MRAAEKIEITSFTEFYWARDKEGENNCDKPSPPLKQSKMFPEFITGISFPCGMSQ